MSVDPTGTFRVCLSSRNLQCLLHLCNYPPGPVAFWYINRNTTRVTFIHVYIHNICNLRNDPYINIWSSWQIQEKKVTCHDAMSTELSFIFISTAPTTTPQNPHRRSTASRWLAGISLVSFYVSCFFLLMKSLQKADQNNMSSLVFCFFSRLSPFKQEYTDLRRPRFIECSDRMESGKSAGVD